MTTTVAGGCRGRREAGGQAADDGRAAAADEALARQLAERARAEGLSLAGPGGLLGQADQGGLGECPGRRDGRASRLVAWAATQPMICSAALSWAAS